MYKIDLIIFKQHLHNILFMINIIKNKILKNLLLPAYFTTCSKSTSNSVSKTITNIDNKLISLSNTVYISNNYEDDEDDDEYENMFVTTSFNNIEWGGPLRGGRNLEPTRFGDWERRGRCTDY